VQGIRFLSTCSNLQIVAAERDYNFEIVRHIVGFDRWQMLDVTELSDADVQICLESIPQDIRRGTDRVPRARTAPGVQTRLSLFEIIESIDALEFNDQFICACHPVRCINKFDKNIYDNTQLGTLKTSRDICHALA